jgi:hypothetical protein
VKFNYSTLRKIELKMINSLNELKTKLRKREMHPPRTLLFFEGQCGNQYF